MNNTVNYKKLYIREKRECVDKVNRILMIGTLILLILLTLLFIVQVRLEDSNLEKEALNSKIKIFETELSIDETLINTLLYEVSDNKVLINALEYKANNINYSLDKVIEQLKSMYYSEDIPLTYNQQTFIYKMCNKYDLDYSMFIGLIELESNFDSLAIGYNKYSQDIGLCQINNKNEQWIEKELNKQLDLFNIYDNIEAGAFMLNHYRSDTDTMTLSKYNKGSNGLRKWYNKYGTYESEYSKLVLAKASKYR